MEPKKENKLGTMPMKKLLVGTSLPLMASMLIQSLYNIVDGIYVARLSEDALTATSLAFTMQMLMLAVALGTGVGVNSLISRKLGAGLRDDANTTATTGLILAGVSSAVFTLIGVFFTETYFSLYSAGNSEIAVLGGEYLRVCMVYNQGIFLAIMCERLLQATGNSFSSMISQGAGAITNIILDPILIFGLYGAPKLGIKGAAIATVVGQYVAFGIALLFNKLKNHDIKFKIRGFRLKMHIVVDIYKVGLPAILMQATGSLMTALMNKVLVLFSTTAVAVFGAYFKLQSFVFMPVFGLNQGLTPIVGYNYGAKNKARIDSAIKMVSIAAVSIMLLGTAVFWIFTRELLGLFEASSEALAIGVPALRIISLGFVLAAVSIVMTSIFQGIGIGWISMVTSFLRQLVVLLPLAFVFAELFGLNAIWWAFPLSELVSLVFVALMFKRVYRQKIKVIESDGKSIKSAEI
ncbi:MAG: MATE family efflux transporter [Oscillospiraceae bacterium]